MSEQLKPHQIFPIQRTLDDPNDTGVYYVRAYIRDLRTDTIIATVELADQGDQRFLYDYEVPSDTSGDGYYISILIKVFTDAAYTVLSTDYGQSEETYLVQERWTPVLGGGGGGVSVDYKKIRNIIKEEIDNRKITPQKEIDLKSIFDYLKNKTEELKNFFTDNIKTIKIQDEKNGEQLVNVLNNINEEMINIKKNIENLPEPEKIDFNPLNKAIDKLADKNNILDKFIELFKKAHIMLLPNTLTGATKKDVEDIVKNNDLQFRKDLEPTELVIQEILKKL